MSASPMPNETDEFEQYRAYLRGLAYRMTGSLADAEDLVQDAYLRWQSRTPGEVQHPRAYLAKLVTRLCLDQLKSARARRESYVGPWLPEPVLDSDQLSTDSAAELAQDISVALMLALERLSPLERAAFLLHDVFDLDYPEVAQAIGRQPAACRKLVERARSNVRAERPRYRPTPEESTRWLRAFRNAVQSRDAAELGALLAEDAVLYSDGGGRVPAALRPICGRDKIVRFFLGTTKRLPSDRWTSRPVEINGLPGVVLEERGIPFQTIALELDGARIVAIYTVRNPDKLRLVSN